MTARMQNEIAKRLNFWRGSCLPAVAIKDA
jgi:hypothetical protein